MRWFYAKEDLWIYGHKIPKGSIYRNWQTRNFGWIAIRNEGRSDTIIKI